MRLSQAEALLRHGLAALSAYFRRYGLGVEVDPLVARMLGAFDRFGVMR